MAKPVKRKRAVKKNTQQELFHTFLNDVPTKATVYGNRYVTFTVKSRKVVEPIGAGEYIRQKIGVITLFEDGTGTLNLAMFPNEDYKIYLYEKDEE